MRTFVARVRDLHTPHTVSRCYKAGHWQSGFVAYTPCILYHVCVCVRVLLRQCVFTTRVLEVNTSRGFCKHFFTRPGVEKNAPVRDAGVYM